MSDLDTLMQEGHTAMDYAINGKKQEAQALLKRFQVGWSSRHRKSSASHMAPPQSF